MNFKNIFRSLKNSDMRNRVLAVIAILIVYRFLAHIPVPLAEPTQLKEIVDQTLNNNSLGGFLNLLSGGALSSFSIMLVGLSPYITASVITQLLTKAVPKLEEMHKDGESGRRRINQWTRVITLPLAILQSIAFIFILRQSVLTSSTTTLTAMTSMEWVVSVAAMTAGAMLLMWLGEIITEKGIGNGISLLIFAGIISQVPQNLASLGASIFTPNGDPFHVFNWFTISQLNNTAVWLTLGIGLIGLAVLYFLVKINEGQRIITINYAKRVRGNSAYGGVTSILPIRLITAGVIPVIFAVAFLALPAFLGQLFVATKWNVDLGQTLILWFQRTSVSTSAWQPYQFIYPICYFVLVVAFTYFYTFIVFNASEIAENLQKQGGFIAGVRPGKATEKYLSRIVNRLTLFGSLALGLISVLPFAFEFVFAEMGLGAAAQNLAIGGTGLLIVVSVALESLRQLNSRALMVTYDEYK